MSEWIEVIDLSGGPSAFFREYGYTGRLNYYLESVGMRRIDGPLDGDSLNDYLSFVSKLPERVKVPIYEYLYADCQPSSALVTKLITAFYNPRNTHSKEFLLYVTKRVYKERGPISACEFVRLTRDFMAFSEIGDSADKVFYGIGIDAVFIFDRRFRGPRNVILKRETEAACQSARRFEWLIRKYPGVGDGAYCTAMRLVCVCATLTTSLTYSASKTEFQARFKSLMSVYTDSADKVNVLFVDVLTDALYPTKYRNEVAKYIHFLRRALVYAGEVYDVELVRLTSPLTPGSPMYELVQLLFKEEV